MGLHSRLEHLDADYLRDPLLLRPGLCRRLGQGFAITLALGVIINLFTAITVTRTLMRALYAWSGEKLRDSELLAAR